jgi:hypothetical protein
MQQTDAKIPTTKNPKYDPKAKVPKQKGDAIE